MGRIMSFNQDGRMVRDFDKSEYDFLRRYGRTPDEIMVENAKLRELARDANKAAHMFCEAWEGSCSKEDEGMSLYAVCPISDTNELCIFGGLYDRMHELGVEVD